MEGGWGLCTATALSLVGGYGILGVGSLLSDLPVKIVPEHCYHGVVALFWCTCSSVDLYWLRLHSLMDWSLGRVSGVTFL